MYNAWKRFEIAYGDIDILVVARDPGDIKRWRKARQVIQRLQGKKSKVRFKVPSISRKWIVGRLVKVTQDTFIILSKRGFDRMPLSSLTDFEVSIGRRRQTVKGLLIGVAGATIVPYAFFWDELRENKNDRYAGAGAEVLVFMMLSTTILSTLIGFMIKSDRWVKVPPQRVNLSISPTPTRGLRAVLSFNF